MRYTVFAVFVSLLVGAVSLGQSHKPEQKRVCVPVGTSQEEIDHVRNILYKALDRALRDHTAKLFAIWMADPADQPQRMISGMIPAIDAHIDARAELQKWKPPTCEPK